MSMSAAKLVWVICNLGFAVGSGVLASKFYGLRGPWMVATTCLLLMATSTRISIGNGQQGLLVLFLWCVALLTVRRSGTQTELAGISYFKFSFAPPVFLYLWLRWGARTALLSLVPALVGVGIVWLWLTGGHNPHALLRLLEEPLEVAQTGYRPNVGDPDLMNVLEPMLRWLPQGVMNAVELGAAMAVCVVVSYLAFVVHRAGSVRWQMALMATMSYGLFKHHSYDAVVLLLPLCYALRMWRERQAKAVLALIGYLFYGQRALEGVHLHPDSLYLLEFGMLMAILVMTYRLREIQVPEDFQVQMVETAIIQPEPVLAGG
jgi:hypothetical protein